MEKKNKLDHADNPPYHSTWILLKKYHDAAWSLGLSIQQVRSTFEAEYGNTVEGFLDPIYPAGTDLAGSTVERHAQYIEQSHKMLKLLDTTVDPLRTKHENEEPSYWLLYYSSLSSQQLRSMDEIIEKLCPHIRDISFRTYYRRRREAVDILSLVLWGYIAKDSMAILEQFSLDQLHGKKLAQD